MLAGPNPPGAALAGPAGSQHPLGPPCSLEGWWWPAAALFLLLGKLLMAVLGGNRGGVGGEQNRKQLSAPQGQGSHSEPPLQGEVPSLQEAPGGHWLLGKQKPWGDAGGWWAAAWHSRGAEESLQDLTPLTSPGGSILGAGERLSPLT